MKSQSLLLYSLIAFTLLTASKCKKDPITNPVDQLPAATQTGANTFGCLINGQVFLPGDVPLGTSAVQANYQNLNNSYSFRLVGTHGTGSNISGISISTDSLTLYVGNSLILTSDSINNKGRAIGLYTNYSMGNDYRNSDYSTKMPNYSGVLYISHLDLVHQVVSGTFWFNAVNQNGGTVKITDGRFDVHFTK